MLEIKNVSISYPDGLEIFNDFSFFAENGENIALIGDNGAGKTTLMLAITGILPIKGKIIVDNVILGKKTIDIIRKKVGLIFQNPDDQLFMPTVYDDIAFGVRNFGIDTQKINKIFKELEIEYLKNRSSLKLSGGEKRLVALAGVLVLEPKILLLDEPTAFLDNKSKKNLLNILKNLPQTMIISSHDLYFVKEICHRAVILENGKITYNGEFTQEILNERL
jgi:cobalt/nickel transport system ATP-binding protein